MLGITHVPLDGALGTAGKVAVLRILAFSPDALPIREVVRRSGMAYNSVGYAVEDLLAIGIIVQLAGGRERRVTINSQHRLYGGLLGLLTSEADFYPALRIELRMLLQPLVKDGLLAAAIVGKVARRQEIVGSALELLAIGKDRSAIDAVVRAADVAGPSLRSRFGIALQLVGYPLPDARAMWRSRTPAAERSVHEAESLVGASLLELLGR